MNRLYFNVLLRLHLSFNIFYFCKPYLCIVFFFIFFTTNTRVIKITFVFIVLWWYLWYFLVLTKFFFVYDKLCVQNRGNIDIDRYAPFQLSGHNYLCTNNSVVRLKFQYFLSKSFIYYFILSFFSKFDISNKWLFDIPISYATNNGPRVLPKVLRRFYCKYTYDNIM